MSVHVLLNSCLHAPFAVGYRFFRLRLDPKFWEDC